MKHIKISLQHLYLGLILVILFGQSVFQNFSFISNMSLLLISVTQLFKLTNKERGVVCVLFLWIILLLAYTMLRGNPLLSALRFGAILFIICYAYFWKIKPEFFLRLLFYVSAFAVFCLYCLELFMFSLSIEESKALRETVFLPNRIGDVFYYYVYYKLELKGTALITFVYILSYVVDIFPHKYRNHLRCFYLIGAVLAGNFAYQMAIVLFHILHTLYNLQYGLKRMGGMFILLFLFTIVSGSSLVSYSLFVLESKADDSNALKTEQVKLLIEDLNTPQELLLGAGLGNAFTAHGYMRDYSGDNSYYEVQTMYVFNQLGLVGFTILVLYNTILTFRRIRYPELLIVYFVYIAYASSNPYIWDTNHIVVIITLICSMRIMSKNKLTQRINYVNKADVYNQ